jgi:hypothetical protein
MAQQAGVSEFSLQPTSDLAEQRTEKEGGQSSVHGDLQILEQCGVGADGVAYRAIRPAAGDVVEVRILNGPIKDGDRWHALLKRLRLVQLAGSPSITRILATQLDAQPPRVVMEQPGETTLSAALLALTGQHDIARLTIAKQVADAMTTAHTVGLVHGKISPQAIRLRHDQTVQIDFSDIDVITAAVDLRKENDAADDRAPELQSGRPADMPADVYSLASVVVSFL